MTQLKLDPSFYDRLAPPDKELLLRHSLHISTRLGMFRTLNYETPLHRDRDEDFELRIQRMKAGRDDKDQVLQRAFDPFRATGA